MASKPAENEFSDSIFSSRLFRCVFFRVFFTLRRVCLCVCEVHIRIALLHFEFDVFESMRISFLVCASLGFQWHLLAQTKTNE